MTITTQIERAHLSRWILTGCVALSLAMPGRAEAQEFSQIVVFGDSLSDPGNAFALIGTASTPPDYSLDPFLIPGAPYARGGHHFQNGATWIEQFARSLGLAGSVRPAFLGANTGATNFAVGGARAREVGTGVNLPAQVQAFLQQTGGVAPSDALYVIALGANDVRDALIAFSQGQDGGAILQAALASIAGNITALHGAGARTYLVWNAPDLGLTPALRMAGPAAAQLGTLLTMEYNAGLATVLAQLSVALPGIQIVPFDAFGLINDIVANPSLYGMTNVSSACVAPNVPPFACENPDAFLFWDGIHPTKATHAIIAAQVAALLIG
jgi:phospholipase/lecithinase/hemolysin